MILGQIADAFPDNGIAGRMAEEGRVPLAKLDDAEEDLDERGLAGAVLAQQAKHFASFDFQADATQSFHLLVALAQVASLDNGHDRGSRNEKGLEREDCRKL